MWGIWFEDNKSWFEAVDHKRIEYATETEAMHMHTHMRFVEGKDKAIVRKIPDKNSMTVNELNIYLGSDKRFSEVFNAKDLKPIAEKIKLDDGTTISVQASKTHYCSPRTNNGGWALVEVGYPTVAPNEEWKQYFDGNWDDIESRVDSVYGYVPIELVIQYINSHGGVKNP